MLAKVLLVGIQLSGERCAALPVIGWADTLPAVVAHGRKRKIHLAVRVGLGTVEQRFLLLRGSRTEMDHGALVAPLPLHQRPEQHPGLEQAADAPTVGFAILEDLAADPIDAVHAQHEQLMQAQAEGFDVAILFTRYRLAMCEGSSEVTFAVQGSGHAGTLRDFCKRRPRACGTTTLPLATTKNRSSPGMTTLTSVVPNGV
ncbi:hypothetical protein D3C73_1117740 [compost metagenome]